MNNRDTSKDDPEIDTILLYDAFKDLNLSKQLKANSTNDLMATEPIKKNIIEFLLFTWMAKYCQFGSSFNEPSYGLAGYGGGGSFIDDKK